MASKRREINFDDVLQHIGQFGKFSWLVFGLCSINSIFCGPPTTNEHTFVDFENPHRCRVPSCDDSETQYDENFTNWTIPSDDKCHFWKPVNSSSGVCDDEAFTNDTKIKCSEWVYDTSLFSSSTVTEFDLVCDKSWIVPLPSTMYMVGMLVGAIVIGDLSDRFGRRMGILIAVLLMGGCGVLSAVSPNVIMFLIMRFLTGAGGVGLFQATFVLAVEYVGSKWRTFVGIMIQVPYALGETLTALFAYAIRNNWRWLQVSLTAPSFIIFIYLWIMPESVRWLMSQGRKDDAVKVINRAAKVNGVELPKHLLEDSQVSTLDGTIPEIKSKVDVADDESSNASKTVIDLLKKPNMRKRSINMFFCWAVCTLVYYGLSSNTGNLGGNIFVNFLASMLIEIPSYIVCYLVLDRMGRKGTLTFVLLLGGGACIISGFIPEDIGWLIITLSLVGKFGIAGAFAIVYVYAAEIFPTDYRSVGIGACSMCARIGGILAPYIVSLANVYTPLPLLVFGVLSFISGLLVILLPETAGCVLPQTLQQSEEFGKDQSIWYFTCFKPRKKSSLPGDVNEGFEE